jgi:hypothetical protein
MIYREAADEHQTHLPVRIKYGYDSLQEPASADFFIHESR